MLCTLVSCVHCKARLRLNGLLSEALEEHVRSPTSTHKVERLLNHLDTVEADESLLREEGWLRAWQPKQRMWLLRKALEERSLMGVQLASSAAADVSGPSGSVDDTCGRAEECFRHSYDFHGLCECFTHGVA